MTSPGVGMLFGFINTASLHLAKGMQRQGIQTLRWKSTPRDQRSGRIAIIYLVGVILNNMSAVWLILANRFAAPAYATGMFGLGLVILLLYSHFILREPVLPVNYLGAALIVLGTALFALHSSRFDDLNVSAMSPRTVGLFAAAYALLASAIVFFALRGKRPAVISAAFGLFAGGIGSLDPVLKALGQNSEGHATFFPAYPMGWIPFLASFLFGLVAFLSVQFAFHRGAVASSMIPVQTSVYVFLPVVVQLAALPGYEATALLLVAGVLLLGGIAFTQRKTRIVRS